MSTSTTTTPGPCNETCPPPDWRDPPVLDPWVITTGGPPTTTTTSTSTTTTPAPCLGSCHYDWNVGLMKWEKTSSDCGEGCACAAPQFCPPNPEAPSCTDTPCVRTAFDQQVPNCTGTTTSCGPGTNTGNTTTPSGCTPDSSCGGCTWYCSPAVRDWVLLLRDCDPCYIGCSYSCPGVPSDLVCEGDCSVFHSDCLPPPPPPPPPPGCSGSCLFVWDPMSGSGGWVRIEETRVRCDPSVSNCHCDNPPIPVEPPECGDRTVTYCYARVTTTTTPGPGDCVVEPVLTTFPPGPPGSCGEFCLFRGDGSGGWVRLSGCSGCGCEEPVDASVGICSLTQTPCVPITSTTTTPGPDSFYCFQWKTNIPYQYGACGPHDSVFCDSVPPRQAGGGVAICGGDVAGNYAYVSGPHEDALACAAVCDTPTTTTSTTTTPGPTTTTTTPGPLCVCTEDSGSICEADASTLYTIDLSGASMAGGCETLNRLWSLRTNSVGPCYFEEVSGDFYGYMSWTPPAVPGGDAVIYVSLNDMDASISVAYSAEVPYPTDCCSTIELTKAAQPEDCTSVPDTVDLEPAGNCTCPTTTTTTLGPLHYCIDFTYYATTDCTGDPTGVLRNCETWTGAPNTACFSGGGGSSGRVIVGGPYGTIEECDLNCYDNPTTTTSTTSGPSGLYGCYVCGEEEAHVCYETSDPTRPEDCALTGILWPTFNDCLSDCFITISP